MVRLGYFFSALDFTLAWRMLLRYPGLTVISMFGMAVGIAIAAGAFTVTSAIADVRLPLPEGERIVSIVETNASLSGHEWRMLHDVAAWRNATTLVDVGLSHQVSRNLIVESSTPEPVTVAEISPSAFRLARVDAFRGRYLLDEDARCGWVSMFAPPIRQLMRMRCAARQRRSIPISRCARSRRLPWRSSAKRVCSA
ncbi:MAG: hypothetical protein K2Y23_27470 [Cyanobacteria bacterium]|nr:hypothetical protein [Cyanobacteriota bacterium]